MGVTCRVCHQAWIPDVRVGGGRGAGSRGKTIWDCGQGAGTSEGACSRRATSDMKGVWQSWSPVSTFAIARRGASFCIMLPTAPALGSDARRFVTRKAACPVSFEQSAPAHDAARACRQPTALAAVKGGGWRLAQATCGVGSSPCSSADWCPSYAKYILR